MCHPGRPFPSEFCQNTSPSSVGRAGAAVALPHVELRETAVFLKARHAKVRGALLLVRVAAPLQIVDEAFHVLDVLRCARVVVGGNHVEKLEIVEKRVGVPVRQLRGRALLALHSRNDLVVDVGEVHDVTHLVPFAQEPSLDDVVREKRPEVANVRKVVHGGTARVEAHHSWLDGAKELLPSGERIEQLELVLLGGVFGGGGFHAACGWRHGQLRADGRTR
ncbi:Cysteinyl-tRNA Synthetase [Gracilaria domingensis]|nr:Cysteinyl-tRNA Synthetase [Gracilaria domingensis]